MAGGYSFSIISKEGTLLVLKPSAFQKPMDNEIVKWWIYKITSPKNHVYIGITSHLYGRMEAYRNCDKRLQKQTLVYNSIRKHGYESHRIEVIDEFVGDLRYARDKEIFWVGYYKSNRCKYPEQNGLNLTDGGDGTRGYKLTEEQLKKHKLKNIGRKASDETKRKMSESQKGKKMNFTHLTPEFRKMMSDRNKQYRHTDEAKKKIGKASKGNKFAVGYKMTPEQIEHRSSLIRGRKVTGKALEEHIARVQKACGKPILQYDLQGNFIKEYPMITAASKETGIPKINIDRFLAGKTKHSRGFIFKRKDDVGFRQINMKRRVFEMKSITI